MEREKLIRDLLPGLSAAARDTAAKRDCPQGRK
jgi:hypothetical protein